MENQINTPLTWEVNVLVIRTYSYTLNKNGIEIVTSDHTGSSTNSINWNEVVDYLCPVSKKGFKYFDYLIRSKLNLYHYVSKSELAEKHLQRFAIWSYRPLQFASAATPIITTLYVPEHLAETVTIYVVNHVQSRTLRWIKRPLLYALIVLLGVLLVTAIKK